MQQRDDQLTGLPSRAAFTQVLDEALASARRLDQSLALLRIDIRLFVYVNDAFGHGVGDRVLVQIAQPLRRLLRPGDCVARAGGDDFWALLPNTAPADAMAIAEHVRHGINACLIPFLAEARTSDGASLRNLRYALQERELAPLTATIGLVAVSGDDVPSAAELLQRAEEAYFAAARSNRVR